MNSILDAPDLLGPPQQHYSSTSISHLKMDEPMLEYRSSIDQIMYLQQIQEQVRAQLVRVMLLIKCNTGLGTRKVDATAKVR